MMGKTSVTIEDINETARNMLDGFVQINPGDPMAYIQAQSTLAAIESFAFQHSVLLSECAQIAQMPLPQRAIAAGLLMNKVAIESMKDDNGEHATRPADGTVLIGATPPSPTQHALPHGLPRQLPPLPATDESFVVLGASQTLQQEATNVFITEHQQREPAPSQHGASGTTDDDPSGNARPRVRFSTGTGFISDSDAHESESTDTNARQGREGHDHGQTRTQTDAQDRDDGAATAAPATAERTRATAAMMQQRDGTSATSRASQQQQLPLQFFSPQRQAQILIDQQQERFNAQQAAITAQAQAAAEAIARAQAAAQQAQRAAAAAQQTAQQQASTTQTAAPAATPSTTTLPDRIKSLLAGVQPQAAPQILLAMAGAVPNNTIPPANPRENDHERPRRRDRRVPDASEGDGQLVRAPVR
jgi:hypothetical protein